MTLILRHVTALRSVCHLHSRFHYFDNATHLTEQGYRKRAEIVNNPYGGLMKPKKTKRPNTRRERYIEAIRNIPKPRINDGTNARDFMEITRKTKNRRHVFYKERGPHENFMELGICDEVCHQLADVGVTKPTQIQSDVIPVLSENKNCVFIGQTGSGKTYTFLLPVIQAILQANKDGYVTKIRSPRVIIMVPTKELSIQIGRVTKHLLENLDINSFGLNETGRDGRVTALNKKPIDIVIATYAKIMALYQSGDLNIEDLQHLIIDEIEQFVDYRVTTDNEQFLKEIVQSADVDQGTRCQVIMTGSILSQVRFKRISSIVPDLYQYLNPKSHLPLGHVNQQFWFVRTTVKQQHFLAMMKNHLKSHSQNIERPLIFCNFNNTAYWLHKFLISHDIDNLYLTHSVLPRDRVRLMTSGIPDTTYPLIVTDGFGLGLDFRQFGLIINYEFPFTYEDYLRRIGRTGRISSNSDNCRAVSYVSHQRDKALYGIIRDSSIADTCQSHPLIKPNSNTGWIKKHSVEATSKS